MNVSSAVLQSGMTSRDVYVVTCREYSNCSFYWLLKTVSYGLLNGGAKWQLVSDKKLHDMCLFSAAAIFQLFIKFGANSLNVMIAKIVDNV